MLKNQIRHIATQDRYCTQHHAYSPREGGLTIKSADGLHERWICGRCQGALLSRLAVSFGLDAAVASELAT